MTENSRGPIHSLEITGDLDRYAAEILRLEIRHLARRYELDVEDFRIQTLREESVRPE